MAYKISKINLMCTFCLILGCCCFGSTMAQKVPAMYVFGDSLVDVGTNNHLALSLAKADFPHNGVDYPGQKATGRFNNGKNTADFLAEKVGLPSSPPYLSLATIKDKIKRNVSFPITGVSFASGGSGIFNTTNQLFKILSKLAGPMEPNNFVKAWANSIIDKQPKNRECGERGSNTSRLYGQTVPLQKQIEQFTRVHEHLVQGLGTVGAQNHLSKSLFAIVIGNNDLFVYFNTGSDLPKKSTPQQYIDSMVLTLKDDLKEIYSFGARKFVIAGVGAIGCAPSFRNQNKEAQDSCNDEANHWTVQYNEGLKSVLRDIKNLELNDMEYSYVDIYSVFTSFLQNPANYGFIEVKSACCGHGNLRAELPCVPISEFCSNRTNHIFWDLYHPTQAATSIFVDTVYVGSPPYALPVNVEQLVNV